MPKDGSDRLPAHIQHVLTVAPGQATLEEYRQMIAMELMSTADGAFYHSKLMQLRGWIAGCEASHPTYRIEV